MIRSFRFRLAMLSALLGGLALVAFGVGAWWQIRALQVKIGQWTLVFDPGLNTPFSVGMTFPNAALYPQTGSNPSMTVENNGKKCDQVEGIFTDNILQTAQQGDQQVNPVTSFDIQFAMRCNKQSQVILGEVKLSQP